MAELAPAFVIGKGRSEEGLARGLQAACVSNGKAVVATKWWPLLRTAGSIYKTIDDRQRFLAPYIGRCWKSPWSSSLLPVGIV